MRPTGNIDEKADEVWLGGPDGRPALRRAPQTKTAAQIAEAAARMGGSIDVERRRGLAPTIGADVLSEFGPEMVVA